MGMASTLDIHGEKGGGSRPRQPVEASDSLSSTNLARILIAVGEGEFEGTPTAADIYLDNTPIEDASGNVNFPNIRWEWRPGSIDQDYVPGTPSVENESSLNVELRADTSWVRAVSDTQLSAVRIRLAWPGLQSQDDQGNINGYRIEYAIDVATDGGAYQPQLIEAVDGKSSSRYERSRRVNLPPASTGWQVRVRRITPNQNSNKVADTMLVAGFTEVVDAKLRYPNTALLYIEFDAEQFTNIPTVTVRCKGRKWAVPSNYDPIGRTYDGIWDGTFKQAWTNNPAWATYGVCTEDRFGLGKRIKPWMVDKWELYRIAQYCDQWVPDGTGGMEARFLCDLNLQGKTDAWSLLRDIAGIYRGMTYWAQGQLVMQADMPRTQDFDYVFTRSNVIDGVFTYGSSSAKTRYSRALVSYDNPDNNYDTDVTVYADLALQRRFGDKPTELSAIGCTRASEAQRRAKWVVLSNSLDRTVTFSTGLEGRIPLPGFIIPVADSLLAGREIGGRISSVNATSITLDRDTNAQPGDRLLVNLPNGTAEGRTIERVEGRVVTVTVNYSQPPLAQLQWALDASDLAVSLYRVLKVRRTLEGNFEISALQYQPAKFAAIDTGARLENRPISVIPVTVVPPPTSVTVTASHVVNQGLAVAIMSIQWPSVAGAVAYDVEWRRNQGNWIKTLRTGMSSIEIAGIYSGDYVVRVRAVSAFGIASIWCNSVLTHLQGKQGIPPAVTGLTATGQLFGIALRWHFPEGAEDTQRTEVWSSLSPSLEAATKLSDLAYPQRDYILQNLRAGATVHFWARLVDRTGNIGPFYPTGTGVQGIASADAGPILDLIAGQIGETELGKELLDEIGKIPGLQDQLDGLENPLAYVPDDAYAAGAIVYHGDRLYQATIEVPAAADGNHAPPNASYWDDIGQVLIEANTVVGQVTKNTLKLEQQGEQLTAQASKLDGVYLQVNPVQAGDEAGWAGSDEIYVGVWSEQSARLEDGIATAQRIDQVQARVNDTSAAVQVVSKAVADLDGRASAMWAVKLQVNSQGQYVAAGIGLGIENVDGVLQSQFLVSADRFAVVNSVTGGTAVSPFAVQGGQVFMNSAIIQNASINFAKISDTIQSDNYIAGSQGWRLSKAGGIDINAAGAKGRSRFTGSDILMYDGVGVLRIKLSVS